MFQPAAGVRSNQPPPPSSPQDEGPATKPGMGEEDNSRVAHIRREVDLVEGRDLQLWSINFLMIMVLAAGFLAFILPHILWKLTTLRVEGWYLPQLFFGLIVLIVLFDIYMLGERGALHGTRQELFRLLVRTEAAVEHSLVDPLTELFSRRYMELVLPKEVGRADRRGTTVTFLMMDVDGFKSVNARMGYLIGDRLLNRVGQLLIKTFRRTDTVVRYGGDEFLVVMHETNEQQAERAVERLLRQVDHWNCENSIAGYKLSFSSGLANYVSGANVQEVLEAAQRGMRLHTTRQPAAP